MALRRVVLEGDAILRKQSKEVKNFGERTHLLLDDMWETMREYDGIGLAAPQVGVLRRIVVIDTTPPREPDPESRTGEEPRENDRREVRQNTAAPPCERYELINPVIVEAEGEVCAEEGCLSLPGVTGFVTRPARVKAKAFDRNGEEFIVEGEGLLAKALCHEIDHLNGILFTDIAESAADAEA
ncbi:MAG: peptide deformylase [Clostridiales Family XIII bacterium]|jgi:peptide deformylase|nr:peptide deformylase [Clostridiales Family XIII bacterium]